MGCFLILQIALHLYYLHHAPVAPAKSPIAEVARAVKLLKHSSFQPARGLDAFFIAYSQAKRDRSDYDAHSVFSPLCHAINEASNVTFSYTDDEADGPGPHLDLRSWAKKTVKKFRARCDGGSSSKRYLPPT